MEPLSTDPRIRRRSARARALLAHPARVACALLPMFLPGVSRAQWQPDGTILSGSNGSAYDAVAAIPDGAGGAIIAWSDYRTGPDYNVYAQRVDPFGTDLWGANGITICAALGDQIVSPVGAIVPDGAGGAIVTWQDDRGSSTDIYAQRINAAGAPLWVANGVPLCTNSAAQYFPQIAPDGSGGAIVTWSDSRNSAQRIYARRVNASGTALWASDGVPASPGAPAAAYQIEPTLVSDAAGGAIIAWRDNRNGSWHAFAQRVSGAGAPLWAAAGDSVCMTPTGGEDMIVIAPDGASGAILAWRDWRYGGTTTDIYAQHLSATGAAQWTQYGVPVCAAVDDQLYPTVAASGSGGAIVAWTDRRNGSTWGMYAQLLDAGGGFRWAGNGLPIATLGTYAQSPQVASDGSGGALFTWADDRAGSSNVDIFAQRLSASGTSQWAANGVALCQAAGGQGGPQLAPDGTGGAIVAWVDARSGNAVYPYAQRVEGGYGAWGHPEPTVASVADVPHDQGGHVAVNWAASGRDLPVPRTIGSYSIWRAVDAPPAADAGHVLTSLADVPAARLRSGGSVYLQLTNPPNYYWELVGTQDAQGWPAYSFAAPTRADSVQGNPGTEYFMVAAHDKDDSYVAYASNALSGHSSDNLAPAPPLMLVAERIGADVLLHWNRVPDGDLRDYSIYRSDTPGVVADQAHFLATAADTVRLDAGAPGTSLYYVVTASDVHANQSPASNEAGVPSATGIGDLPAITGLMLLPNHPNPFETTTEFDIGLPSRSDVSLEIFDVGGRLLRTLTQRGAGPGWVRIPFEGRDASGRPLASGVDFCRVTAGGKTVTRRIVVAR